MSVSFRAASVQASVNSTALTLNKPTGTAQGDLLIAHVYNAGNTSLPTTVPSGWSLADSFADGGLLQMIYTKTAGASEPSTYEWDWAVGTIHGGIISSYQSSISAAMGVNAIDKQANTSSVTTTFKSVTTTVANTLLVFIGYLTGNTPRAPDGGEDERWDTGLGPRLYGMTTPFVGPGATGTHTSTGVSASTSKAYTIAVSETINNGSVAVTLDNATLSATGTVAIKGAASVTLDDATVTGTATNPRSGSLNVTLADATLVATATNPRTGAVDVTLADATLEATGAIPIAGAVDVTLANATLSASGLLPPHAPSNVMATAITASRIDVTWDDDNQAMSGFSIERSANGTTGWSEIASVAADVRSYGDTGLASNTRYYYRIRGFR